MSIPSLSIISKQPIWQQPVTIFNRSHLLAMIASAMLLATASLSANASTLISSTDYLEYELPKTVQDHCLAKNNCPDIDIKYLKTNQNWINTSVNARINNIAINSKPSESKPTDNSDAKSVKVAIDDFAKAQFVDMPEGSSWSYQLMVTPNYLGHVKLGQTEDFELFEINSYVFTGGAHGMPFSEYLIFDPTTKKQIKFADILQTGKESRFEALAYTAYKNWVKTVDQNVSSYEKNWPFTLSDNVTFTDKGIDIRYQHYDIGPYAYGMPVLSIPYSQLNGIIKPRFIPK